MRGCAAGSGACARRVLASSAVHWPRQLQGLQPCNARHNASTAHARPLSHGAVSLPPLRRTILGRTCAAWLPAVGRAARRAHQKSCTWLSQNLNPHWLPAVGRAARSAHHRRRCRPGRGAVWRALLPGKVIAAKGRQRFRPCMSAACLACQQRRQQLVCLLHLSTLFAHLDGLLCICRPWLPALPASPSVASPTYVAPM